MNDDRFIIGDGYDWRDIRTGTEIPSEGYCDQPYVVITDDGTWLLVMTTGVGHEGSKGQHIISMRSIDKGKTWIDRADVECADGPEASYAVLLKTSYGRIYCFYNHNTDDIRRVKADKTAYPGGWCNRVDSLGHYVYKYSDDNGLTWSDNRYDVPVREMDIDRQNAYGGSLRFFWNVGKPFILNASAYISLHKVGGFGSGFFTSSEGVLLKSDNILYECDPDKIEWQTLPEGEKGLRTPEGGGLIAEEQSYSVMSDDSLYCVYRSVDGHPVEAYSRQSGRVWSEPRYMLYADRRMVKHPRAANFVWRCQNGNYLYWFHNHGGKDYEDRNPVWILGGVEAESPDGKVILWSQPEVLFYDDDPFIRISYPDLIEENGEYYITETEKETARIHAVDPELLEGMWRHRENADSIKGEVLLWSADEQTKRALVDMVELPDFTVRDGMKLNGSTLNTREGFSIIIDVTFADMYAGQILLDNRDNEGCGFCLRAGLDGHLEFIMSDGQQTASIICQGGLINPKRPNHIAIVIDSGARIIYFAVNGKFCDGGNEFGFGFSRFSQYFKSSNGSHKLQIGSSKHNRVKTVRMYNRALKMWEIQGDYRYRYK